MHYFQLYISLFLKLLSFSVDNDLLLLKTFKEWFSEDKF